MTVVDVDPTAIERWLEDATELMLDRPASRPAAASSTSRRRAPSGSRAGLAPTTRRSAGWG